MNFEELGFKRATEEQLDAAISDEDIRGAVGEAWLHEGDVELDEVDLGDGEAVIVLGDLRVKGSIATDETATLIVKGNLTGRHLFLEGNLEVHGNATLRGVVYGFYEAGLSYVYGRTTAKAAVIGNHCWECDDEAYEIDVRFSNHRAVNSGDPEKLRALMGDAAFKKIERLLGLTKEDGPPGNDAWSLKPFAGVAP